MGNDVVVTSAGQHFGIGKLGCTLYLMVHCNGNPVHLAFSLALEFFQ